MAVVCRGTCSDMNLHAGDGKRKVEAKRMELSNAAQERDNMISCNGTVLGVRIEGMKMDARDAFSHALTEKWRYKSQCDTYRIIHVTLILYQEPHNSMLRCPRLCFMNVFVRSMMIVTLLRGSHVPT